MSRLARLRGRRAACVLILGMGCVPTLSWAQSTNRALLVGVSRYPNLEARWQLQGPPNDVVQFREFLLRGRFASFDKSNIKELAGWPTNPAQRPTRANIAREFQRLADVSRPGDQVVILMAGHGSQQPDDANPDDPEPDGLDETFLPADVGKWDGQARRVTNAIADDEIGAWLRAIRAKGAFVWILFDSCHSGTMTRGLERTRGIPASEFIAPSVLARLPARSRGSDTSFEARDDGIVAMYAVQPAQTTPEMPLPPGQKVHGLFTFTVVELLEQATEALSYRELVDRVNERYRAYPRFQETPAYEGAAANRAVLGQDRLIARPPFILTGSTADGKRTLLAGRMHGVMENAILSVYPPAGATGSAQLIGHVRAVTVRATEAMVEPIAFDGRPAPDATALPPGARCRLVRSPVGNRVLSIGSRSASPSLKSALDAVNKLTSGTAIAVAGVENADWIVREDERSGEILLEHVSTPVAAVPTSASRGSADSADSVNVVSAAGRSVFIASTSRDPALSEKLSEAVAGIARVQALRSFASTMRPHTGTGIRLQTVATVYESQDATAGRAPETGPSGRLLRPGQYVEFVVKNTGTEAADLTVLFLDGSFGIKALYPVAGRELDTRIAPGAEVKIGRYEVDTETVGQEDLIVIGVPARTPAVSFVPLEQPALNVRSRGEGTRGRGGAALQAILAAALGGTRGNLGANVLASDEDHDVSLFSWTTAQK